MDDYFWRIEHIMRARHRIYAKTRHNVASNGRKVCADAHHYVGWRSAEALLYIHRGIESGTRRLLCEENAFRTAS